MTNSDKRAWLDWAVEVGLLHLDYYPDQYKHTATGDTVAWIEKDKSISLNTADLTEAIYFEIDKREWVLKQEDVVIFHEEQLTFESLYSCTISKVKTFWTEVIGQADEAIYRLDALMEAFQEACEAEG